MKRFFIPLVILCLSTFVDAQISDPKNVAKEQGTNRANSHIEQGVDKGFDKLEEGLGSLFSKKKKKSKSTDDENDPNNQPLSAGEINATNESNVPSMNVNWSKFDFVPGDEVIFADGPDANEENGEFPSRWDLVQGQVEVANVNGENAIIFISGNPEIIPYLKESKSDYLPDVFTIEFDIYRPAYGNRFMVDLYDVKNQDFNQNQIDNIEINLNRVDVGSDVTSEYNSGKDNEQGNWIHVSMAYTKGKFKVYLDETRLINIPHFNGNPSGFTIQCYFADMADDKAWFLKNMRIAKGGVKYYDRMMQEGKIICNGIRFDVNKATLRPESMGPINEIYSLMQKQPDLKFSIEGHTDSDGDDAKNQSLSEQRAKTVMDQLISMGISAERLSSKGFGESAPITDNTSSEGKANNRRVEFVRK